MNPYADQSENEFSIHCLKKEDMEVLRDSIRITFRQLKPFDPKSKPMKKRLVTIYSAIDECLQEVSGA